MGEAFLCLGVLPRHAAAKLGYGKYHAHLDFMDLVADQYGFDDHASRRLHERIKDTLDPNSILQPCKQGIRPEALRSGRAP